MVAGLKDEEKDTRLGVVTPLWRQLIRGGNRYCTEHLSWSEVRKGTSVCPGLAAYVFFTEREAEAELCLQQDYLLPSVHEVKVRSSLFNAAAPLAPRMGALSLGNLVAAVRQWVYSYGPLSQSPHIRNLCWLNVCGQEIVLARVNWNVSGFRWSLSLLGSADACVCFQASDRVIHLSF